MKSGLIRPDLWSKVPNSRPSSPQSDWTISKPRPPPVCLNVLQNEKYFFVCFSVSFQLFPVFAFDSVQAGLQINRLYIYDFNGRFYLRTHSLCLCAFSFGGVQCLGQILGHFRFL